MLVDLDWTNPDPDRFVDWDATNGSLSFTTVYHLESGKEERYPYRAAVRVGRGVYGRETCAVVVRHPLDLLSAVVGYLKDAHVELSREALREIPQFDDLAQDGMGRDVVVY